MKMQENIAMCMYEVHRLMLMSSSGEQTDVFPEWEDMTDQLKTYWIAMADAALEIIEEPDSDMIEAVLKVSRVPVPVDNKATWEETVTEQYVRLHTAGIKAAKMDWRVRSRKK